jgi:hypothetical protein
MPAPQRTGRATTNQSTQTSLLGAYQAVIDEQRQAFEAELAEERAKFEAEKAEQLATWKKELARTKDEDNYQFNKEKREREDKLVAELAKRVADVSDRETKVKERELAIGDAEKTISVLQNKVDAIPQALLAAEDEGFKKGYQVAKKEAEGEAKIVAAQTNATEQIYKSQLEAFQATVTTQVRSIENLQKELNAANARVQEIANNAVTAAGQAKVTVQNTPATSSR